MILVAQALVGLKTERALVVHSNDGLDEISLSAPTSESKYVTVAFVIWQ
jgi:anthranilate phosphoribosyltransferase